VPERKAKQPVFERSEFDEIFGPALSKYKKDAEDSPPPDGAESDEPVVEQDFDVEPMGPPVVGLRERGEKRGGFRISPTQATWLSIATVLAIALAFAGGVLVGLYLVGPARQDGGQAQPSPATTLSPSRQVTGVIL
jgi:hypothetical protein